MVLNTLNCIILKSLLLYFVQNVDRYLFECCSAFCLLLKHHFKYWNYKCRHYFAPPFTPINHPPPHDVLWCYTYWPYPKPFLYWCQHPGFDNAGNHSDVSPWLLQGTKITFLLKFRWAFYVIAWFYVYLFYLISLCFIQILTCLHIMNVFVVVVPVFCKRSQHRMPLCAIFIVFM